MSQTVPSIVFYPSRHSISYNDVIATQTISPSYRAVFDLCTSDGFITSSNRVSRSIRSVTVKFNDIDEKFCGFHRPHNETSFCLKSSINQLGVVAQSIGITLEKETRSATVNLELFAETPLAILTLDYITKGCYVGKLFCADKNRQVRTVEYINRLLKQTDMMGEPLLIYGSSDNRGNPDWELQTTKDGRVIGWIKIKPGTIVFDSEIVGLLPTIGRALKNQTPFKSFLHLHQATDTERTKMPLPSSPLIIRSYPLYIKSMFARVAKDLLPSGIKCDAVLEPTWGTLPSVIKGRTFILYGESSEEVLTIPLEFYSLEPYRESLSFDLRATLPLRCRNIDDICKVFDTMPKNASRACTFICKGSIFDSLTSKDWVTSNPIKVPFVGIENPVCQRELVEKYLYQQCEYGILSAISVGDISSDGVLFTKCFPSYTLKSLLLSRNVHTHLRALYFIQPSAEYGLYFSQEDQTMLADLITFGILSYYVDTEKKILYKFLLKKGHTSGMFVPIDRENEYLNSTSFGVYGSNLIAGNFENELRFLLSGILEYKKTSTHKLLNNNKPLSIITGGGPGAMEIGNKVAKSLGILSCGLFVDFKSTAHKAGSTINEQRKNPYVEAFMSYRANKLVERQSDFNLDFPIFLTGGIGTDFEYSLEEVRRKVCVTKAHPLILFGAVDYWCNKITARYQENVHSGTIKGSEWLSNIPWVVQTGKEALAVLTRFFDGTLPCGPKHPPNSMGLMVADEEFMKETASLMSKEKKLLNVLKPFSSSSEDNIAYPLSD